jgi:hypothetical protein
MVKEYIEREAAVSLLLRERKTYRSPREVCAVANCAVAIKELIPTADVAEVRHGEWIFEFELDGSNFYRCSVCGRQEVLLAKESTDEYFPYCHCGCKMDGKGEGE